jgi:hypothetical protein
MPATYGSGVRKVPSGYAFPPSAPGTGADLRQHLTEPEGFIELLVHQHLVPPPVVRIRQRRHYLLVPRGVPLQFQDSGLDGRTEAWTHLYWLPHEV